MIRPDLIYNSYMYYLNIKYYLNITLCVHHTIRLKRRLHRLHPNGHVISTYLHMGEWIAP